MWRYRKLTFPGKNAQGERVHVAEDGEWRLRVRREIVRQRDCTRCYDWRRSLRDPGESLKLLGLPEPRARRTFRMRSFAAVIQRVMLGQGDDLGGGVFKERLRKNQYRSIVLARTDHYWVYEYLFAKQNRANIADDELADFRRLVKA